MVRIFIASPLETRTPVRGILKLASTSAPAAPRRCGNSHAGAPTAARLPIDSSAVATAKRSAASARSVLCHRTILHSRLILHRRPALRRGQILSSSRVAESSVASAGCNSSSVRRVVSASTSGPVRSGRHISRCQIARLWTSSIRSTVREARIRSCHRSPRPLSSLRSSAKISRRTPCARLIVHPWAVVVASSQICVVIVSVDSIRRAVVVVVPVVIVIVVYIDVHLPVVLVPVIVPRRIVTIRRPVASIHRRPIRWRIVGPTSVIHPPPPQPG